MQNRITARSVATPRRAKLIALIKEKDAKIAELEKRVQFERDSYRSLAQHHNQHCVCMEIY